MIYSDTIRQALIACVCANFLAFSVWALLRPKSLAEVLGYSIGEPNGHSEFGAIYVGVFFAQALLCCLAFVRIDDEILGDMVAAFLLLQPIGRLIPLFRYGSPKGLLRLLFVLEAIGGAAILAVRPDMPS